jgi:hypothetical protein
MARDPLDPMLKIFFLLNFILDLSEYIIYFPRRPLTSQTRDGQFKVTSLLPRLCLIQNNNIPYHERFVA